MDGRPPEKWRSPAHGARGAAIEKPGRRWIEDKPTRNRAKPRVTCARCKALEMANRPDIKSGTPSTWEAMVFCGLDPLTGEVAA
jgi:hypothetical protein